MKWHFENPNWIEIQREADREAIACLVGAEREVYDVWKKRETELRKLLRAGVSKRDAMHPDHLLPINITMLERSIEPSEYGDYTTLADAISPPDYLELIKQSQHDEGRICRFSDEQLEESYWSLKEKQRQAVNQSVIHDIDTAEIAKHTGISDRNIRQLRQRGIGNLRNIYAKLLWEVPYIEITHRQYIFLQWMDEGMPDTATSDSPAQKKQARPKRETAQARYERLCGPCLPWEPIHIDTAVAGKETMEWTQK